jgi:hypothetical protein
MESLNKLYESYKLHMYSKCGIVVNFSDTHDKYKNVYITESIATSHNFCERFMKNLLFTNKNISKHKFIKKKSGNMIHVKKESNFFFYHAVGLNKLKLIYELKDGKTPDYIYYSTTDCIISKELVNKIFNIKTRNNELSTIFPDTFLKLFFSTAPEISWINDNDFILYPNLRKTFYSYDTIKLIKEKQLINNHDDISIDQIYFEGLIKCDNYNDLLKLFKANKYQNVRMDLYKSEYRSVLYITNSTKLQRVYNSIVSYFKESYGVYEENILIDLPIFNIINKNYQWIYFSVIIRDIYKGFYEIRTRPQSMGVVTMKDLIKYIDLNEQNKGDTHILDGMYRMYAKVNFIEEYKLNEYCPTYEKEYRPKIIHFTKALHMHMKKYNEYSTNKLVKDDIITNGKLQNFKIINVIVNANSLLASSCGVGVCCIINEKHYIFSIIPQTFKYLSYDYTNKNSAKLNLYDFLKKNIDYDADNNVIDDGEYGAYFIKHYYVNNLKYSIQIMNINPYTCDGCNNNLVKDNYLKEIVLYNKKQTLIKLKGIYDTAQVLLNYLKENFEISLHIIIYNVIRNIIICYNTENRHINDYIKLFNIIIDLEEKYNKLIGHNYRFFPKLLEGCENIDFYTNNGNIFVDEKYRHNFKFICVYGKEYMDYKKNTLLKYLIWYTAPDVIGYDNIKAVIYRIVEYIEIKINEHYKIPTYNNSYNRYNTFHQLLFNKEQYGKIYYLNNEELDNVVNKYVYNISALIDNKNKVYSPTDDKINLDEFIKFVDNKFNEKHYIYRSYTNHYPTFKMFQTLHIHVTFKKTLIMSSSGTMASSFNINSGKFATDSGNMLSKDYMNFNPAIWGKHYSIIFIVLCNKELVQYLEKNYEKILNNINNYNIYETVYQLLNSNIIFNVFAGFTESFVKEYLKCIFMDNDNRNMIVNLFNNFLKYKEYYNIK